MEKKPEREGKYPHNIRRREIFKWMKEEERKRNQIYVNLTITVANFNLVQNFK
jgi:hypothetical protein